MSTSGMELVYSCEGLCLCDIEFKLLQLAEVNDVKRKESIFWKETWVEYIVLVMFYRSLSGGNLANFDVCESREDNDIFCRRVRLGMFVNVCAAAAAHRAAVAATARRAVWSWSRHQMFCSVKQLNCFLLLHYKVLHCSKVLHCYKVLRAVAR